MCCARHASLPLSLSLSLFFSFHAHVTPRCAAPSSPGRRAGRPWSRRGGCERVCVRVPKGKGETRTLASARSKNAAGVARQLPSTRNDNARLQPHAISAGGLAVRRGAHRGGKMGGEREIGEMRAASALLSPRAEERAEWGGTNTFSLLSPCRCVHYYVHASQCLGIPVRTHKGGGI